MKWLESRILWGALLILGGILFLLQNLGWITFGDLFWAVLVGLGAIFFLGIFFSNRLNWWALIPGIVLASITLIIGLGILAPSLAEDWSGSIVLGSIGLSFAIIFMLNRQMWWAIIPAGVLFSLAIMLGLENYLQGIDSGGIFLLGLGITFGLLALTPTPQGRMWWPWIPAGVLFVIGLILSIGTESILKYLWPLALILGGGALLFYTMRSRKQ